MQLRWKQQIAWTLAATMLVCPLTPTSAGDQGLLGKARSKLVGLKRSTEYNHVEQLALCLDELEEELLEDGTVVAKGPDVWGEARLTRHRQEFERELQKKLDKFELRLNASLARSDQAFLANAFLLQHSLDEDLQPPDINATQINNLLPPLAVADKDGNVPGDTQPNAMVVYPTQPGALFANSPGFALGAEKDGQQADRRVGLEPTIELDQLARYINHLHEIRRLNEGDDTADSPGYSLNLVRIPVSILPGSKTRKGYGAEITVTVEPTVTDELLPTTFRQLVINDLVDQLSVPLRLKVHAQAKRQELLRQAYIATRDLLIQTHSPAYQMDWFTFGGFVRVVDGVAARYSQDDIAVGIDTIEELWQRRDRLSDAEQNLLVSIVLPVLDEFRRVFPEQAAYLDQILQRDKQTMAEFMKSAVTVDDPAPEINLPPEIAPEGTSDSPPADTVNVRTLVQTIRPLYGLVADKADQIRAALAAFSELNSAGGVAANASVHRRARSPLSGQNLVRILGPDLDALTRTVAAAVNIHEQTVATSIRSYLRDELETAYEAVFDARVFEPYVAHDLSLCEQALVTGVALDSARQNFHSAMAGSGIESGSNRDLLGWAILAESLLLSRQLNADIRHVSQDPGCQCALPGVELPFYGLYPPQEARQAFTEYVKCRWPIHVFALDPVNQEQNVGDQFALRREMQLALAMAFAAGRTTAQNATRYLRRLEMDLETITLNRTAVAFGHGNDTFGWRFAPRVQTPEFESNHQVLWRDLLIGGPDRDDLRSQWELEPGMRECVAIVLMPSFITHVRFDCRGHFFPLTCEHLGLRNPSDARTSHYDAVSMSRMVRQMQNCAACAVQESHLYRDGEVERLLRRTEQLSRRLPLQTSHSRVPNENTLGGFEMFSSGVTDLAPELLDWYGEPGFTPGKATTIFLTGNNFSVTGTRVIAGNRAFEPTLLSREVMEVTIPGDAAVSTEQDPLLDGVPFIDIHVATPYGVSQHVHVPLKQESTPSPPPASPQPPAPALTWEQTEVPLRYRWKPVVVNKVNTWTVEDDGILMRKPQRLVIRLPDAFAAGAPLPATADFHWTASLQDGSEQLILQSSAIAALKYLPDERAFAVEGAALLALHKEIKDRTVAKLKVLGATSDPGSSPRVVTLSGFISPTASLNPRIPVQQEVTFTITFQPEAAPPPAAE